MRTKAKLILAALAAAALLSLAAGGASARSLSVSERNFELIWNNALTGKTKLSFGDNLGHHIDCNITLLGHYSANTIAKTPGINQGTINHGELESCVHGTLTLRTETMPWNVRYIGFTGRLPAIETISTGLIGVSFSAREESGLECTSSTEAEEPGVGIIEGTSLENVRADETRTIELNGGLCGFASPGRFTGRGLILNLPRTAKITVTLIGGTGEPPTLSPSPISFGTLEVESLARRTVTLTAGSEVLTVRSISVRAGNYFAITDPNRCVGARVEARRTCAFRVLFSAPGESGREFSDTVIVETSVRRLEDSVTART